MQNRKLVILVLSVIIVSATFVVAFNNLDDKPSKGEIDIVVNQAGLLFRQKLQRGEDLSEGPCLSNALMPDWVLDIVHDPRIPSDDLSQNQCPGYLEGRAKHFVELDLEGRLVRVK